MLFEKGGKKKGQDGMRGGKKRWNRLVPGLAPWRVSRLNFNYEKKRKEGEEEEGVPCELADATAM